MKLETKIILIFLLLISITGSFFVGRYSYRYKKDNQIISIITTTAARRTVTEQSIHETSTIRASKQGSKYYYPWCTSTFKEENTIFFSSKEEAEQSGYSLATNCLEGDKN